ncbi:MAG: T9SS type A sorting domain-containing protein [Bacteroidota bacterium]
MTLINNINSDPQFLNPSNGEGINYDGLNANWNLHSTSPCINSGTPDTSGLYLYNTDIAGNNRIIDDTIDIGAYEYNKENFIFDYTLFQESGIVFYPNPTKDNISIIAIQSNNIRKIEILDMSGKIIIVYENPNTTFTKFDLSNYPQGIYFVKVISDDGIQTGKIIKQ